MEPYPKVLGVKPLKEALRSRLEENPKILRALVSMAIKNAIRGSFPHFKLLAEMIDGPVSQPEPEFIDWSVLDNEGDTERPGQVRGNEYVNAVPIRVKNFDHHPEPPPESINE